MVDFALTSVARSIGVSRYTCIISIHMSTNAVNMVEIGQVVAEIFGGYANVCRDLGVV